MNPDPRPVVVGVDDTPESLAAAAAAAELARARQLPLRLVRALPAGAETVRTAAAGRLDAVRRAVADVLPHDAVTAVVRAGPPDLVLLHESRTAALLVVGPSGGARSGLDETAEALVRGAHCPVLLARVLPDEGGVVVGVDGGPGTAALLAAAADVAIRRGTALLVLHAWDRPCGGSATVEAAVEQAERELLEGYVRPLREGAPSLPVDLRVVHAPPAEVLVQAAQTAAVVVVGRRPGRRGGTVAAVADRAPGPVLVVPLTAAAAIPRPRRELVPTPA
ncbi:universal stress protein [Geodermatophilus sp. URMC 64]